MLENITLAQVVWLRKNKLTLSHIKYLEELINGNKVPEDKYYTDMEKIGIIFRGEVSNYGHEIYKELGEVTDNVKLIKKKVRQVDEDFEKWWKAYPSTPSHGIYISTRNLKVKKDECQKLLRDILDEVNYTVDDLIRVLNLEVRLRKSESITRNADQMQYMKGTHSYLNSRGFEAYFEYEKKKRTTQKNYSI